MPLKADGEGVLRRQPGEDVDQPPRRRGERDVRLEGVVGRLVDEIDRGVGRGTAVDGGVDVRRGALGELVRHPERCGRGDRGGLAREAFRNREFAERQLADVEGDRRQQRRRLRARRGRRGRVGGGAGEIDLADVEHVDGEGARQELARPPGEDGAVDGEPCPGGILDGDALDLELAERRPVEARDRDREAGALGDAEADRHEAVPADAGEDAERDDQHQGEDDPAEGDADDAQRPLDLHPDVPPAFLRQRANNQNDSPSPT